MKVRIEYEPAPGVVMSGDYFGGERSEAPSGGYVDVDSLRIEGPAQAVVEWRDINGGAEIDWNELASDMVQAFEEQDHDDDPRCDDERIEQPTHDHDWHYPEEALA